MRLGVTVLLVLITLFLVAARGVGSEESTYRVVFDSNRSGSFGIFSIKADGSDLTTIFDSKHQEMNPAVSPDGKWIAFARSAVLERNAPSDIWMVRVDGSEPRLLVKDGAYPSFGSDNTKLYFNRGSRKVMSVNLETSKEEEIFPKNIAPFSGRVVNLPRMSPDGRYLAFSSDYPNRWKTWVYDFKTSTPTKIGHGCEPNWSSDSKSLVWVSTGSAKSKSGIFKFDLETKQRSELQDSGEPFGHEYFPHLEQEGELLFWAACPVDQHSHFSANYQLFSRDLATGTRVKLTNDTFTNRWPVLLKTQ